METKYIWTTLRTISEANGEKVESDPQKVQRTERNHPLFLDGRGRSTELFDAKSKQEVCKSLRPIGWWNEARGVTYRKSHTIIKLFIALSHG